MIFQSNLPLYQALDTAEEEVEGFPEVRHFISFIRDSERGVTT
jgi:acyl-[acyl carrier protein]--UDP-N-acetylglucosamine O-acyltransferase